MNKYHSKKGFTLIELVIVMCVFSILGVAFVSVIVSSQMNYQKEQARVEEIESIRTVAQIIDSDIRASNQNIRLNVNAAGCFEISEVYFTPGATENDEPIPVEQLYVTYCLIDETIHKNGQVLLNGINDFKVRVEDNNPDDDIPFTYISVYLEGLNGGDYDQIIYFRR